MLQSDKNVYSKISNPKNTNRKTHLIFLLIDTGDTAWMLTATSMVLLMSPGVGFFLWWIS
jgi:Amt family ammonium transporter